MSLLSHYILLRSEMSLGSNSILVRVSPTRLSELVFEFPMRMLQGRDGDKIQ